MPELGKATYVLTLNSSEFNAGMAQAEGTAAASTANIGRTIDKIGSKMRRVGKTMTTHLTLPIVAFGLISAKMALDFNESMKQVQTQAGGSAKEVTKMSAAIMDLAKSGTSTHGPNELAKALFFVESAGIHGSKAMEVLKLSEQGATVSGANLGDVAKALSAAMNVGTKDMKTATQAMGILNAVVGQGQMTMQDLTGALSTGALGVFKAAGLGMRDFGAALDIATSRGTNATTGATRLKMALLRLTPTTKAALGAFKEMGLQQFSLVNAMKGPGGFPAAIDLLRNKYDAMVSTMGKNKANLALQQIFPRGSVSSILQLIQSAGALDATYKKLKEHAIDFPHAVAIAMHEPINQLKADKVKLEADMIDLGKKIVPVLKYIVDEIVKLVDAFLRLDPSVKKLVGIGVIVIAALGPVLMILGSLAGAVSALIPVVAFLITPLGLVVLALVALGLAFAAAMLFPKQFEDVLQKMGLSADQAKTVVETLQSVFGALVSFVKPQLDALVQVVQSALQVISGFIKFFAALLRGDWTGAWNALKQIVSGEFNIIKTVISAAFQLWMSIMRAEFAVIKAIFMVGWNAVKSATEHIWNGIKALFSAIWSAIRSVFTSYLNGIKNDLTSKWNAIKSVTSAVWNAIKTVITAIWPVIKSIISSALNALKGIIVADWNAIVSATSSAWNKVSSAVRAGAAKAVSAVVAFAGKIVSDIINLGAALYSAALDAAKNIGQGFVDGIRSMISDVAGAAKDLAKAAGVSILHHFGIKSPSTVTHAMGLDIAKGLLLGILDGTRDIPSKVSAQLQRVIDAGRAAIDRGRTKLSTAFSHLSDEILQAFDRATDRGVAKIQKKFGSIITSIQNSFQGQIDNLQLDFQTPTERLLASMQEGHTMEGLNKAVSDAQAQLNTAMAATGSSADPQAVIDAQQQLKDAQYELTVHNLEQQAAAERLAEQSSRDAQVKDLQQKMDIQVQAQQDAMDSAIQDYQDQRAVERYYLEQQLTDLETQLSTKGMTQDAANKKIIALMKAHGLDMGNMGELAGNEFAKGLKRAEKEVTQSAAALARIVKKYLALGSPAEVGPMSTIDKWWDTLVPTLTASIDTKGLEKAAADIATKLRGALGPTGVAAAAAPNTQMLADSSMSKPASAPARNAPVQYVDKQIISAPVEASLVATLLSRKLATARNA